MFIGREREISSLQGLYDRDGFQMPVLYGRRRVGKTRLIREFCRGKPVIFYTATQDEAATCLRDFTASIREYDRENALLHSMEAFPSWDSALDYSDSIRFFPNWSREDALYAYGACDGFPQYLSIFSKWGSFREAVEHEFLTETGGLLDEPAFLLKEELREPALYNSIVEAVADGFNRGNEIASRVGKTVNILLLYLSNLISLQILERQSPVENTSVKKNIFRVQDKLFLFWYRFIPKCRVQIAMGLVEEAFEKKIRPYLAEYFGHVFEDICLQYIQRKTMNREIETVFDEYGKWWGTNPAKKCQEEIDLVCVNSEAEEDGLTLVDLGEIISPMVI